MTDPQLLMLSSAPTMLTVLIGILVNNSRLNDLRSSMNDLRSHIDIRFDEMRETWRAELLRVEGVVDARLTHLERRGL